LPVLLCLDRAGLSCSDGDAHHGLFDIALLSCFPNLIFAQPSSLQEFRNLLWTALHTPRPFAIRYPRGPAGPWESASLVPPTTVEIGRAVSLRRGGEISLWALGQRRLEQALELADALEERGHSVEVIDARFICPLDVRRLENSAKCSLVVALEDHVAIGGFAGHLQRELAKLPSAPHFLSIAWPFPVGFAETNDRLERRWGQSTAQLSQVVLAAYETSKFYRMENFPTRGSNVLLSVSKTSGGKGATARNLASAADFGEKF
jgi:1-deoxy-D-xylulose-5-phosphate synthase